MKLFYILNSPLPTFKAHGLQVVKMCEAFVKNNIDCELIMPDRGLDPAIDEPDVFKFYGVKNKFSIKKLNSWDFVELQWKLRFIPRMPKLLFWLQQISFGFSVRRYLKNQAGAIVYSRDQFALYFLRNANLDLFWEAHQFPSRIEKFFYQDILIKIKGLIVITQKLADKFSKYYKKQIVVAPDAVDIDDFNINISKEDARRQLVLPEDKKLALYMGHIYKWKGSKTMLECINYLDKDTLLVIVGGTEDDLTRIKILAPEIRLDQIKIIPYVLHNLVPLYLKAADVLLLTGNSKDPKALYYTSPLKMFEYMASGRPIVAHDLPSFREVLNDDCAFFVKPGDPKELAIGIDKALSDYEKGDIVSENALKKVRSLSWVSRASKIYEYVNEALSKN